MGVFPARKYRPEKPSGTGLGAVAPWYRRQLQKRPFLSFGLPFLMCIVGGSFALTPVTAIRYEMHDRKVRQLTQEEALGLGKNRHKFDIQEDYQRLMGNKDLDDWENKRVKRLPGENDGVI